MNPVGTNPVGLGADLVLAHHQMVVALPFFVPALLVVATVGAVVWRDRRATAHHDSDPVEAASCGGPRDRHG